MSLQKSDSSKYDLYADIARGAFCEVSERSRRQVRCTGKRLYDVVKSAERYIMRASGEGEKGCRGKYTARWLDDNGYIIRANTAECLQGLSDIGRVLACDGVPLVYCAALLYLHRIDRELDSTACTAFADVFFATFEQAVFEDMYSVALLMKCACIELIAQNACVEYAGGVFSVGDVGDDADCAENTGNLIGSLKYISYHDFGTSFRYGAIEKVLESDPSGHYGGMSDGTKAMYREKISELAKKRSMSELEVAREALKCALEKKQKSDSANAGGNSENRSEKEKDRGKNSKRRKTQACNGGQTQCGRDEYNRLCHIGTYLFGKEKGRGRAYFIALGGFTALIWLLFCMISPVGILLLFPVWEAVKIVVDTVFSRLAKSAGIAEMSVKSLGNQAPVLVVITSLLSGEKRDGELFDRLERLYLSQSICYPNSCFGILGDLPDSKTSSTSEDNSTIEYACGRIEALNRKYGNVFCLFIRQRRFSKSECSFMGWERKRGAVIELVRYLKGKATTFGTKPEREDFLRGCRYVVTLDADTNMPLGSLARLVGAMEHPLNRPVFCKESGRVCKGYGIMQPPTVTEVSSAGRTPFSRIMCGEGGTAVDVYSGAGYDLYQALFGEGTFCGKGIFDVDAFYRAVDMAEVFPEDYILSHDILEGERLRCAAFTDVTFTDSFPKNALSYLKRSHRWIRGDVQNLVFAFKRGIFSPFARFKIFDNVRRALTPVMSFIAVTVLFTSRGAWAKNAVAVLAGALLPYITVIILDAFSAAANIAKGKSARRFYSYGVITGFMQSVIRNIYLVSMLPKVASLTLGAVFTSLKRMLITKSGLIEWQTAAQSDLGDGSLLAYVWKNMVCAVFGAVGIILSGSFAVKAICFLWFVFPVVAYFTSSDSAFATICTKSGTAKGAISEGELETYARDIWHFFEEYVTKGENYLPPDNVSVFPANKVAHRTSPTNIGLYLMSVVCAADFGFIDAGGMCRRIGATLDTIERLPKLHGHLYNWYSTSEAKVLSPRFISTVDSGNLLACYITVGQALREYVSKEPELASLIARLERLADDMDFSVLYDSQRNLFSVGMIEESSGVCRLEQGCYDLLMSEARTTGYINVANGTVPEKHWRSLSRGLITAGGYMGLSSWTGTAFEYFMPCLFLPIVPRTMNCEAMGFAYRCHRDAVAFFKHDDGSRGRVFGISESGFFGFDPEMNYGYKAFGVEGLGLKRGLGKEKVISPYSSFLFLPLIESAGRELAENFKQLKSMGMYGKYGFYEAVDFTPERVGGAGSYKIIGSWMAHHMGMSLGALCNARFSGIMCRRFMSHAKMACARELLCEKIPVGAVVSKSAPQYAADEKKCMREKSVSGTRKGEQGYAGIITPCVQRPYTVAYSCGKTGLVATSSGHIELKHGKDTVLDSSDDAFGLTRSLFCFVRDESGQVISPAIFPDTVSGDGDRRYFKSGDGSVFYGAVRENERGSICVEHGVTVDEGMLVAKLSVKADGYEGESFKGAWFGIPVLCGKGEYEAHPAFKALSVEAKCITEQGGERIVVFSRRRGHGDDGRDDGCGYLAVCVASGGATADGGNKSGHTKNVSFDTRLTDVFCGGSAFSDFGKMKWVGSNNVGACISPAIGMYFDMAGVSQGEECGAELALCFGSTEDEVVTRAREFLCGRRSFESIRERCLDNAKRLADATGVDSDVLYDAGHFMSCGKDEQAYPASNRAMDAMLSGVFFGGGRDIKEKVVPYEKELLWRHGISGDLPIVAVKLSSRVLMEACRGIVCAYRLLRLMNVSFDLCFLYEDTDSYSTPVRNALLTELADFGAFAFSGRKDGGIFLVRMYGGGDDVRSAKAIEDIACRVFEVNSLRPVLLCKASGESVEKNKKVITSVMDTDEGLDTKGMYAVKGGYLAGDGVFYTDKKQELIMPYSHILAGENMGSVITQSSLGFTFCGNASEKRITDWSGRVEHPNGERLFIRSDGVMYDLCAVSRWVKYEPGRCVYCGSIGKGLDFEITVYVCSKLRCKVIDAVLRGRWGDSERKICFYVKPVMGKAKKAKLYVNGQEGLVRFGNVSEGAMSGLEGFVCARVYGKEIISGQWRMMTKASEVFCGIEGEVGGRCAALEHDIEPHGKDEYRLRFALGAYGSERELEYMLSEIGEGDKCERGAEDFARSLMPQIKIRSGENGDNEVVTAFSGMFNVWLAYQNGACRFFARSGYYQAGGAYGFRDQLQDCLCLMYSRPDVVKRHILRCASRQFESGDVLHWWHEIREGTEVCKGVRTRCSDDYLWLVYTVYEYVRYTGDVEILRMKVPYIEARELEDGESEAYLTVRLSGRKESLFQHLRRALDRSMLLVGTHGLPLMGSCDWSDGLNGVGKDGKGESVWLAMFLYLVVRRFTELCRQEKFVCNIYKSFAAGLIKNVYAHAVSSDAGYFIRGFYDDGEPLGDIKCDECKIDLLPQAFMAMCRAEGAELTDEMREFSVKAQKRAYDMLYDGKARLTALFTPAFRDTDRNPGYIKGYVAGIRENGGQYTHAAVWAARGMFMTARSEYLRGNTPEAQRFKSMGEDIFMSINPLLRTGGYFGEKIAQRYLTEPYVLCADIYSNEFHTARGGWSWYSGAAGWYYTVMLREVLGVSLEDVYGRNPVIKLSLLPLPFNSLDGVTLEVKPCDGCVYEVIRQGGEGEAFVTVDGRRYDGEVTGEGEISIPIVRGVHRICIGRA